MIISFIFNNHSEELLLMQLKTKGLIISWIQLNYNTIRSIIQTQFYTFTLISYVCILSYLNLSDIQLRLNLITNKVNIMTRRNTRPGTSLH